MSAPKTNSGTRERIGRFGRLVAHPAFWLCWVVLVFGGTILRAVLAEPPRTPEVYGEVPAFELVDQTGQPFSSEKLRGRIWVANFIFTRCTTVCPVFTDKMFDVQHHTKGLGTAIQLLSFSVDPEYDTPEMLAAYAHKHKASPRMWKFLTGDTETVRRTVVDGLKMTLVREGEDPSGITHSTYFVLGDGNLRIRGYYDSTDEDTLDRMLRDIQTLLSPTRS